MSTQAPTPLFLAPKPYSPHIARGEMPYGATIAQGLTEAVRNGVLALDDVPLVAIYIDGERLDRDTALDFVPADGQVVNVVVEPQGGDTGKAIFQLFYTIGAAIVSFYFGPIWGAVVTIAGNVITNAIWAPERDSMADGRGRSALQGGGNSQRLRQMMPLALGRQRVAFDQAGLPISDNVGPDVWLTIPLAAHYGPCTVEDIKIGETLLSDYPASDYQLETFLTPGPRTSRLYPSRIVQDNYQDKLDFTGGGVWEVQAAVAGAARLSVDITLPSGLKYNADSGKVRNEEVTGRVEFAEVGTENWQPVPTITGYRNKNNQPLPVGTWYLNLKTNDAVRRTFIWDAPDPAKQYKVRVKAWDSDGDFPNSDGRVWDTYWTALRSIFDQRAFVDEQLSILVLRIKSSDDLNGNLPPVTGVVTPICPVWKNGNWNTSEPTSNAAALLRWIMTGPAPATPLLPSEIDASLADQYELIETRNWHGAYWLDRDTTQEEAIIALGRMGRFSAYWNGERLCVVPDWGKPVARQLFTERNVEGYRYQRQLPEPIHAVLVEFRNLDEDSRGDEVWVYADGYDATTAENFISATIDFACTKTRAFIEGRVYLAKYELMVETHEWTTFGESLVATFGDRVRIRHSVGLIGAGEGRVQFCRRAGAMITGVRLDDPVTMQAGRSYAIDVRCGEDPGDGMLMGLEVVTAPGTTRDLVFPTPLAPTAAPRANDLVAFGERGLVTEDVEIVDIVPAPDGTAKIVAVPYLAAEIEAAETGPVPELPTTLEPVQPPPTPRWVGTPEGDPTGARAAFDINPARADQVASFVVRIQRQGDDGLWSDWAALSTLPATARQVTTPPFPDAARQPGDDQPDYVVRLDIRAIMSSGEVSRRAVSAPIVISKGVREPQNVFANGVVRTDASGASYPALHIACDPVAAGGVQDLQVEVHTFGSTAPEWRSAGQPLPAANPSGDLLDVLGGETLDVRVRWRTADNWYSPWVVTQDPVMIPDERISSDTVNVGGTPAADLLANLASVEALANATAAAVEAIEGTFDEVLEAAEQAAQAATNAAASAATAATAANTAETEAAAASASAIGAAASASDADTSASASAASAAIATAKATDAEQSATAAEADRLLAQTARGEAQTSATQAASSRDDAAGSAASASASATLAANSRDAAAGSASAAAGSASTATTKASEAGTSAAAAMASQVSASTAAKGASDQAAALLYSAFDSQETWTNQGAPAGPISGLITTPYPVVNDPDLGLCIEFTHPTAAVTFTHKGPVYGVGKSHRLVLKAKCVSPGTTGTSFRDFRLTASLGYITVGTMTQPAATAGQIVEFVQEVDTGQRLSNTAGAEYVRFGVTVSGTWRLSMLSVEDVTESRAAGTAATAAATSASSASASETAAGQSATAASGSATNAATSAGQALTYSNQASSSAADANAASVSAGVAASMASITAASLLYAFFDRADTWTTSGVPAGPTSGLPTANYSIVTDPDLGQCMELNPASSVTIGHKGFLNGVGKNHQIRFKAKCVTAGPTAPSLRDRRLGAALNYITAGNIVQPNPASGEIVDWTIPVPIGQRLANTAGAENVRYGMLLYGTWRVSMFAVEDVTESVSAANSAAAALTQAANASASAASAQISADLAASVGMDSNPNLLPNSTFADGFTGWVAGTGWVTTSNRFGPYALTSTAGTSQVRMTPRIAAGAGQIYTLSGDFLRTATSGAVMADIEWFNSSDALISRSPAISVTTNRAFGSGRLSTTGTAPAGTATLQVRFYGSAWAGTALGVRQLKLEFGDKATTWRDDAQLSNVSSQLKVTMATTADLETRMATASFEVTAAAGGNPAYLGIKADSSGSWAGLKAQALAFSNVIGGTVVEVMKIIGGSVYITGKLFMGAAGQIELDPTYPLILWKFGNARLAIGQLPNDNLFFWFGAGGTTAVTAMRKNNAKVWFDTNGNSYWGGSILAGTISNSGQGTNINVPSEFILGPFGTNGGPITIAWSYEYSRQGQRWGNQVSGISGSTSALVRLYRRIAGQAETLIDSMTVTGDINAQYDGEPVPGQPSGTVGQTFFTEYMGSSRTYTDTAGGTQQRTYRIQVVTRSLKSVPGDSNAADNQVQRYGITSSE